MTKQQVKGERTATLAFLWRKKMGASVGHTAVHLSTSNIISEYVIKKDHNI